MAEKPSTTGPVFIPRRGMRNGHMQTLAGNFLPRANGLPPAEARLIRVAPDAEVLCHCHWQPGPQRRSAMTVVIVHGLEGSSESQYVIGTGSKAWRAGMNVVRLNMRNCGGTERLSTTLYHSGMSGDIAEVAQALIAEGIERIALCGYSMGGNLVLKCAGEWGSAPPREVKAVAGVSPAMDLGISSDTLHSWSNRVYELKFLWGLNRRIRRKAALFPQHINLNGIRWSRSLREFDERVTARFSGFTGADDYYQRASSARVAAAITLPTLVIHSADDPFIILTPPTAALLRANPHVQLIETAHGGHCAFLSDPDGSGPAGYDGRWAEREVIAFFQSHA